MLSTTNRQILILENPESDAFEQVIFMLKENVIREEEILVNEAREVVARYMKKYEKGVRCLKKGSGKVKSTLAAMAGGALMGAFFSCLLFWF
ncbi:MAG: hypothetical protein IJE10_09900 [Clostridia bacterium]|nr:hypothetical protein [Clostridia bacterium]